MRKTFRLKARPEHAMLGKLLRQAREDVGLSHRQVGAKLGRGNSYMWKIEQGIQVVDIATLFDLAAIYGVTAAELVWKVEANPERSVDPALSE